MKQKLYFLIFLLSSTVTLFAQQVSTLAGSGNVGSTDATGTAASFYYPTGVAVDGSGNVYVADYSNHKIRKITPAGVVTTLAGSGSAGNADATGTAASFFFPSGVAVDGSGNVYVADYNNHKIRKITPAGVVTTLAGSGNEGSTDATGTAASFNNPVGVAVDGSGNVYVADYGNHKIRKITPAGVVTTLAGSGTFGSTDATGTAASFSYPNGVAVDGSGNVYVADSNNHKIRKITPAGVVTTLAGSGSAGNADATGTAASFFFPSGVAVDGSGNVYVADYGNHKIRKITPAGVVTTLAGSGSAGSTDATGTAASFNSPTGVAADGSGNVYIADYNNHKIRKISSPPATHLNFDGVNDRIVLSNESNFDFTNQMTAEFWMNSNVMPEVFDALVAKGDNSWRVALTSTGTIAFAGTNAFIDFLSTTSVTDGNWHHVAVTYDGANAKIYIDGSLENQSAGTANINNSTYAVSLGENLQMPGRYYTGNMDEVRIWNVARTADQIAASRSCELQGNEAGLVAYYKFNQGFDTANNTGITSLTDATANANNGTLTNFTLNGSTSNWLAGSPITTGVMVPSAPTASNQTFCATSNPTGANLVPALSSTIKWYTATGNIVLSTDALSTQTYYVVQVNTNGCESERTAVSITVGITTSTSVTDVICNGGSNGAIDLTVSGGTSPYTFAWNNGATTEDLTGLSAGTYSVTVTDVNNCTTTQSLTITEPAAFTVNAGQDVTYCSGETILPLTADGFQGDFAPENWTFANSNADGNVNTSNAPASIAITGGNNNSNASGNSTFSITFPANATVSFNWNYTTQDDYPYYDIPQILINNTPSLLQGFNNNISGSPIQSGTMTVSVLAGQTFAFNMYTQDNIAGSATVVISNFTVSGSTTYSWEATNGGSITGATNTQSIQPATSGTYTVTATNSNGCTATDSVEVTIYSEIILSPSQTNVSCYGGTNGAIDLTVSGGTGPYTFVWNNGITTEDLYGLSAGTYTVTVTDANNCLKTQSFTISQPDVLTATAASQTNVTCNGGANGSATVSTSGGTGTYIYSWSPSGGTAATASGLVAGTYTVTVTDDNLCSTTQSFTISQPDVLTATAASQTNVTCNGGANGSATVSTSGGTGTYTYSWSPSGGTAATASGLVAGTYTVTVTDDNLCSTTQSFTITQPDVLTATAASQTNVTCNGGANGSATVSTSGGTGTYTYSWSPSGGTAATASGLVAGTYTVTVTDDNLCSTTQSFTITQPAAYTVNAGANVMYCANSTILPITATTSIDNNSVDGFQNNFAPDNWFLDFYNSIGQINTSNVPSSLTIVREYYNSFSQIGGIDYSITSPVTATISFDWSYTCNDCFSNSAMLYIGSNSHTIYQPGSLIFSGTKTINVQAGEVINFSLGGNNNQSTASLTITNFKATTYSWTASNGGSITGATNTQSIQPATSGTYTVTATNANGCTATDSVEVTIASEILLSPSQTNVSCNGGTNGAIDLSVSGGTSPYTFVWNNNATTEDLTDLSAGTYSVTVTDANLCTTTQSFAITQPAELNNTITENAGTLTANQNGATYQWYLCPDTLLAGETNQSFTPTVSGDYRVVITSGSCFVVSTCTSFLGNTSFDRSNIVSIYPNPSNGIYTIETNQDIKLEVYDMVGKFISKKDVLVGSSTLDLLNYADGVYLVKATNTAGDTKTYKVVKRN